ncbi:MAG: hypothetical protein IT342_22380 [Candidatus Melainabacteria bacterium]|nr:hypothetical protein [Candidatus Melainabacteria bacterium]
MPKAKLIQEYHQKFANGARVDIIIWQLPAATAERPHRLKYRLNYCGADGTTLVRYDNERGKGDHKHVAGQESKYVFKSVRQLFEDFRADVLQQGGTL